MDNKTLESFINYCDDMMITEESFNSFIINTVDIIDSIIRKAIDLVQRMLLNFKKLKKYRIPNDIRKCIVKVRSSCDVLWFKLISGGENSYYTSNDVDDIKRSKAYTELFFENKNYSDDEYVDVPVNAVVTDLQKLYKTLTNTQISYNKAKRREAITNTVYWDNIMAVLQISIKALNKYFSYGKTVNENNEVVDMPDFEVEIIDS